MIPDTKKETVSKNELANRIGIGTIYTYSYAKDIILHKSFYCKEEAQLIFEQAEKRKY